MVIFIQIFNLTVYNVDPVRIVLLIGEGFFMKESKNSGEKQQAPRELSPAAKRALAEAEERRNQKSKSDTSKPKEVGGRGGLDPVRYGDWEKDGIISDF